MTGYISEFQYVGDTSEEFIEVALPAGTNPAGYTIQVYDYAGYHLYSFSLGTSTGTMGGHDVYVINASTPGFDDGGADATGNLYPDDGIALVDGSGNVAQFVSYWGTTVTAVDGDAAGATSTDVGTADYGESLQSDDGGSTYYTQSSTNAGSIPACFGRGTLIATPRGPRAIEHLRAGDWVVTSEGVERQLCWTWRGAQPLSDAGPNDLPVLIRAGAFGADRPAQDLIVSGQHRILVGACKQLDSVFSHPQLVPAKALCGLPRIRFMHGKKMMEWHHLLCEGHEIVLANGLASETLLLGPMVVRSLDRSQRVEISQALGRMVTPLCNVPPKLPCLTVAETTKALSRCGQTAQRDNPNMRRSA